jgi:uncharacterized membrane protein YhaH (DUF805 family)
MEWMLMPLRRYADFSGRSRRKEYWMFTLFVLLVYLAMGILFFVGGGATGLFDQTGGAPELGAMGWIGLSLFIIFALAIFVPSLAVIVRRLHDQDKSGWFILLQFIPYIGGVIMLIFMCIDGTRGENRYGPDPKGENIADVFS